jgi:GntR family transcriptional regulator
MSLRVDRSSEVPVGAQLVWALRSKIEAGELGPGDRLPSLRDVAAEAGVNVNTVRAAYGKLEAVGAVRTEQGRGTFVTAPAADDQAARRRELRDEIARLESQLVSLPILNEPGRASVPGGPPAPRLLSVDELTAVRDLLAGRVDELRAARAELVGRVQAERTGRLARRPSSRSSSSRAGARVRWTSA